MKKITFKKTNIIGGNVDDVVNSLKEAKEKATWLDGNLYVNNMLIFIKEKKTQYIKLTLKKYTNISFLIQ